MRRHLVRTLLLALAFTGTSVLSAPPASAEPAPNGYPYCVDGSSTDPDGDVSCLNQSQSFYGLNTWFAGHRNGQSGVSNPNTADISRYRTAIYWIQARIDSNSANRSNDTRFWVNVPAI